MSPKSDTQHPTLLGNEVYKLNDQHTKLRKYNDSFIKKLILYKKNNTFV